MMKMNRLHIVLTLIALLVFSACSEQIELELNTGNTRLVVEGQITDRPGSYGVRLSLSTSYFYNEAPPAVEDAVVSLSDGSQQWLLSQDSPGYYALPEGFAGEAGHTYHLSIAWQGETYEASSQMLPAPMVDSLSLLPHPALPGRDFLMVHFQDPPGTQDFYVYYVYLNGVLLTDSINEVLSSDDQGLNGQAISTPVYLLEAGDEAPVAGDVLRVEQYRVSEAYYQFLIALRRNQGTTGGPFAGPPANVPGNLSKGALGFFLAASVGEAEMVVE